MTARIDFADLASRLHPETLVPAWLPDGRRQGREWLARNPTRHDTTIGSFSINLDSGQWSDFATGDAGGDLISLRAYLFHGGDQMAAARELIASHGFTDLAAARPGPAEPKPVTSIAQPRPIMPIPPEAGQPDLRHPTHGEASRAWAYYDRKGRPMLYVARFDHADGRKDICPLSWCDIPGRSPGWRWRGITGAAPRPLYGLDRLAALPNADVLIVEGEKAADAAQALAGHDCAVVSWLGGTSTADRVNVRPLRGRRVTLWPDFDRQVYPERHERAGQVRPFHDQPGARAMLTIGRALGGIAEAVQIVGYNPASDRFAPGWDLADAQAEGWKWPNVHQFMTLHAGPLAATAQALAAPDPDPAPTPPADPEPAAQPAPSAPPAAANDNAPVRGLDEPLNWFGWPHQTEKGAPQNTIENTAYLLREYGIGVAYNLISKDLEITIPGRSFSIDNRAGNSLAVIASLCARNRLPKADLSEHLAVIADQNPRNPAADWITSRPWDGVDRLPDLVRTLDPHDPDMALLLLRRWLIGAVACAMSPTGVAMQGVLVIQGPQGAGKTTWLHTLAGQRPELFRDGVQMNPADRDSVKQAISYWIVELGELDATFRKADIAALKAFITRDRDELRLPYMRGASTFPRRTAFAATVNEARFLRDETGNRRYWTIQHGPGLVGRHAVDVQQVWAQMHAAWQAGEQHPLTRAEMDSLNTANEVHTETSAIEELIASRYDWTDILRPHSMTATEVLIAVGYDRPTNPQAREANAALRRLTGGEPRKVRGRYVFTMPRKVDH